MFLQLFPYVKLERVEVGPVGWAVAVVIVVAWLFHMMGFVGALYRKIRHGDDDDRR